MPSYHLHLTNAHIEAEDEHGVEAADLDAARCCALEGIRDFLAEEVKQGRMDLRGKVEIADGTGCLLMTVAFDDAVQITRSN
jgi:hypothetical protein